VTADNDLHDHGPVRQRPRTLGARAPLPTVTDRGREPASRPEPSRTRRRYDTAELFGPEIEIEIVHEQSVYLLRITRQGKLILNK
jgi:hemin uptake protein HemP